MELEYMKNIQKNENGKYDCPYNSGCECERMKCGTCGWNPKVDQARRKARLAKGGE